MLICQYDAFRSALEDAAEEDAHDELGDSDDDLLESSEEEDEDEVDTPQRMPDPKASESAGLTDPSACGSRTRSSFAVDVSPNTPAKSSGLVDDSHIQTRSGVRPSVAFQMKEMEGRPSKEDHDDGVGSDGREQDGGRESKASSGSAENLVREYMVSGVHVGRHVDCQRAPCSVWDRHTICQLSGMYVSRSRRNAGVLR